MLERAGFDVLLILDCCHAAGAVTKGSSKMEVLAGCGQKIKAAVPGAGNVFGSPFTSTLIKHLEEQATQPNGLLIKELQALLSYDEVLKDQSPIHVVFMGHYSPIKLRPLVPVTEQGGVKIRMLQSIEPPLKVTLAISCQGRALPDREEFVRWLKSQYSKETAQIEVEEVGITTSNSCPTFTLLSIPIFLWAYLQGVPDCLLVGFVKPTNVLTSKADKQSREDVTRLTPLLV
jgi:hypothetical protein